jgi:hypothetical protein
VRGVEGDGGRGVGRGWTDTCAEDIVDTRSGGSGVRGKVSVGGWCGGGWGDAHGLRTVS